MTARGKRPGFEGGAEFERLRADAEYMHFLVAAGELLSSSLDYRSTLRDICATAVVSIADICLLDIGSPHEIESVGAAHRVDALAAPLAEASAYFTQVPGRPAHPSAIVLDSGQTLFVPFIDEAWITSHATSDEHAAFMRGMNFRSMIVVPVRSLVWGISGTLTLVRTELSAKPYDEGAVVFAEDLGRRCGIAIGKARLHSQTLDIAERLQRAALPKSLPFVPGFTLDSFYEPAETSLLVGGDWYDAFMLENGSLGLSIGDVAGHGIESAALMSSIRNALRMALLVEPDLRAVLRHADFLFRNEAPKGAFCTALVAVLEPTSRSLSIASAGHPLPMTSSGGNVVSMQHEPGLPLAFGDMSTAIPATTTVILDPGSLTVFYTDGLIELQRNALLGERALRGALASETVGRSPNPARALREAIGVATHPDDIAILTLRVDP